MLRSVKDLEKCGVDATDGAIGTVQDFYFDDESWVIRYLIVDTGTWLKNRTVFISPHSIRNWDWQGKALPLSITREQVEHSPIIGVDEPVSRQQEKAYLGYYGYPYYWGGTGLWGPLSYPEILVSNARKGEGTSRTHNARAEHANPHLRSCNAVSRYYLQASDGEIGHLQGYLIDETSWAIRFLIVNTSNWWLGHQVLIAPEWIDSVSWLQSTVTTGLSRQAVKESPAYDPAVVLEPAAQALIYTHYGRSAYAIDPVKRKVA